MPPSPMFFIDLFNFFAGQARITSRHKKAKGRFRTWEMPPMLDLGRATQALSFNGFVKLCPPPFSFFAPGAYAPP